MKKIVTIKRLMLVVVAICWTGARSLAYDMWVDGIFYNIVSFEDRTVEVTSDGDNSYSNWVDVPGSVEHNGRTFRVVGIGDRAFYGCRLLEDITVAEGVEYIGQKAFGHLQNVTSLTLPSTMREIRGYAFADFTGLKTLTVGGTVLIGEYAFQNCSALSKVTFKGNVTKIGENAFDHCGALTAFSIPSGVEEIGENAFLGCYALTSFKVSGSNEHFSGKDGVIYNKDKTVLVAFPNGKSGAYVIPETVTEIASCAFAGCKLLTELTIPAGCTTIGFAAFNRCQSLASLTNLAKDPQEVRDDTFAKFGTLHVRIGCKVAYKTDATWAKFRIVEDASEPQTDAVGQMVCDQGRSMNKETSHDLLGRRVGPTSRKGIRVLRGRKVVVQ